MASFAEQLDAQLATFFSTWNVYTTVIAIALAAYVIYPLIFLEEPDTHPLLLARQARSAPVRQPGESAVYRSVESTYGYPLRSGLNVKDADAPRWSQGRDGDLRDVWRSAVAGAKESGKSLITTVYGKDEPQDHSVGEVSKSINVIGAHLQKSGKKVAIYLPNCVEYLSTVFAASFYGLSIVLLPYNQPHQVIVSLLEETGADCLVAEAGSLPLDLLSKSKINAFVWVVAQSSRHMDWTGEKSAAKIATWHDLVERTNVSDDLPKNDIMPGNLTQIWMTKQGVPGKIVEFTQGNLVAAIAGLGLAIPQRQRLTQADLVLAADSFSSTYVLCNALTALYSHASLAINSVAGPGVELALAARTISPTVIIASAETMEAMNRQEKATISNPIQRYAHSRRCQTQAAGRLSPDSWLLKLLSPRAPTTGTSTNRLRLILVAERLATDCPALSSQTLTDLRIFTQARICYALTAPDVAGAVAQTNLYDYRVVQTGNKYAHFGAPLACCEVMLTSADDKDVDGATPRGEINVIGPSVVGGRVKLGVRGQIREDCTLAYA
ncbi:hypothetical protein ANO11243_018810 [Dothideomycetidae sp. 11243]|nr:hypothetical protein ANO11243_018810 [fungal sp. No.11243]